MERMGDILARAANRRANGQRVRHFDGAGTNGLRSSSASNIRQAASSQPLPSTQPPRPTNGGLQLRHLADAKTPHPTANPLPDAQPAPAATPPADVLDSDRILELPTRRQPPTTSTYAQRAPRMNNSRPRISTGMQSLREATGDYLAGMPQRRSPDAASTVPNSTTSRQNGAAAMPALPADVCPICHGAGYVRLDVPLGDPSFGQAVRCQCKERQIADRDRGTLRRLSNLDPFQDKTFETFDLSTATQSVREACDVARHFAESFGSESYNWLVIGGGYGTGKTHLAAAIANYYEDAGVSVIFAIVPDLLDHLRAAFAPSSEATYDELFDKVREVQLLVLDDLGAENSTAWATEKLFQLINYRYNYRMPTIITTNHRLLSHMDERIRSRLADKNLVRHLSIEAPDYRERHMGGRGNSGGRGGRSGR